MGRGDLFLPAVGGLGECKFRELIANKREPEQFACQNARDFPPPLVTFNRDFSPPPVITLRQKNRFSRRSVLPQQVGANLQANRTISGRKRPATHTRALVIGMSSQASCMLVCSEIPFVGSDPTMIRKAQKKVFFLVDHWPCARRLDVAPAS